MAHVLRRGELDLSHKVILYLDDVTVSFDGFRALNRLTLAIDAGELRCIIGPNGAGKTTMMDVITGKTRPDSGTAFFGQTLDLTKMSEPEIAHAGIGRKFQKPTIFERHSVFENLELAMKTGQARAPRPVRRGRRCTRDRHRRNPAHHTAGRPGRSRGRAALPRPEAVAGDRMLLMQDPKLLLLDEPVAGMTDEETERTGELFLSLAGRHSLVVVEHDMAFIGQLGGKVTVLNEGSVLAEGDLQTVQNDRGSSRCTSDAERIPPTSRLSSILDPRSSILTHALGYRISTILRRQHILRGVGFEAPSGKVTALLAATAWARPRC